MVSPTWSESVGGRGAEESTKSGGFTLVPSVSQFRRAPPPHYTTVSTDGSAPLGQHKYCTEYSLARAAQFR